MRMLTGARWVGLLMLACGGVLSAQTRPEFDVASVRASSDHSIRGSEGGPGSKDPTLYRFGKASLLDLICVAWHVDPFQVSSAKPLDRRSFDVSARLPEGASKEQFGLMLQNLLSDRFALKTHVESRQLEAYQLVIAKSGLKMHEAHLGDAPLSKPVAGYGPEWPDLPKDRPAMVARVFFSGGYSISRLRMQLEPLSILAQHLPKQDNLPIVDQTGLTGKYTFDLEFAWAPPNAEDAGVEPAPPLAVALKQQLGLELVRARLPFDVVVVDSVNLSPTEN